MLVFDIGSSSYASRTHSSLILIAFLHVNCSVRSDFLPSYELSPPSCSAHGILQVRILEWVAVPFFRGSPQPWIELRSPTLNADSSPSEPPGKHNKVKLLVAQLFCLTPCDPTGCSPPGLSVHGIPQARIVE